MKLFNIDVRQEVDLAKLRWPYRSEIQGDDVAPAGNQHYQDLRGFGWSDVAEGLRLETQLIERLEVADRPAREEALIVDELAAAGDATGIQPLCGLDVGVASAVLALSAAGAIPAASCNGGAFGSFHAAANPYVAFYARPRRFLAIQGWAKAAGLGLEVTDAGVAVLHASRIADFLVFASAALGVQNLELE